MSTATSTLPTWAQQLSESFCSPKADTIKAVSDLFGTVLLSNIPRPGDAGSWNVAEWRSWALANGFYEDGQAKHGKTFINNVFSRLRFAKSDSGGDFRSSMALATEVKRSVRTMYQTVADIAIHYLSCLQDGLLEGTTGIPTGVEQFVTIIRDAANGGMSNEALQALREKRRVGDFADREEVGRVTRTIEREFGLSPKLALGKFMARDDAERTARLLKESPAFQIHNDDLDKLVDVLDSLRADEAATKEAKRREREEREQEKQKRDSARLAMQQTIELTPQQIHDNVVADVKRGLLNGVQSVIDAQNILYKKLQWYEDTIRALQLPSAPITDTAKVNELEGRIAELSVELDAFKQVHGEQSQQLAVAQKEVQDLTALVNAPNPFKDRHDDLLAKVEALCSTSDFVETAGHIATLRQMLKQRKIAA